MKLQHPSTNFLTETERAACAALASHGDCLAAAKRFLELQGEGESFHFAMINEIAPMIAHALHPVLQSGAIRADWDTVHQETLSTLASYLHELDRVAALLAQKGIPLVALKNGGIARGIHPCHGCCPMGDLDVLVRREDFRRAHALLLTEGYHFEFRSNLEEADLQAAESSGGAEYWVILPNGQKLWFELQWRPVAGRWLLPDQEPSSRELIDRSIPIPGTTVRLLSPEDNLLQVALHTAKHSYVRAPGFRLHLDVDRIVHGQTIDWDLFTQRVTQLQVKTPVYFSLLLPSIFFRTPIPDAVLERLRPSIWKERLVLAWLRRAGFFNPDERKFGRIGYISFTMLLYDDFAGIWRSIFPKRAWMIERYRIPYRALLPFYHVRRLMDLAFRRART